jgi:hypothetical protein
MARQVFRRGAIPQTAKDGRCSRSAVLRVAWVRFRGGNGPDTEKSVVLPVKDALGGDGRQGDIKSRWSNWIGYRLRSSVNLKRETGNSRKFLANMRRHGATRSYRQTSGAGIRRQVWPIQE